MSEHQIYDLRASRDPSMFRSAVKSRNDNGENNNKASILPIIYGHHRLHNDGDEIYDEKSGDDVGDDNGNDNDGYQNS